MSRKPKRGYYVKGHFVPEGIDWSGGAWLALTNDPFLLHFLHRWWSWVAALALLLFDAYLLSCI